MEFYFEHVPGSNPVFLRFSSLLNSCSYFIQNNTTNLISHTTKLLITPSARMPFCFAKRHSRPLMARNWEMLLEFKVHGAGRTLYGDGFAMWYVAEGSLKPGDIFGAKNNFKGLGIFFDTYSNHNPLVVVPVGMHRRQQKLPTQKYDHDTDGTHNEIAGCQSSFRGQKHDTVASIKYINNVLTVHMDARGKNKWTKCFEVKNVILPIGYHLGFSAQTGQLADNHDILMLKTYEVDLLPGQIYNQEEALKLVPSAEGEPERLVPVSHCLCVTCDFGRWVGSIQMPITHRKIGQNGSTKNSVVENFQAQICWPLPTKWHQ
eukprot:sb/3466895/